MAELALAQRLKAAADALEELSAMHGFPIPDQGTWSARELRAEVESWVRA